MAETKPHEVIEHSLDDEAVVYPDVKEAMIGYTANSPTMAVYDFQKCVEILMERDGMDHTGAEEYIYFNMVDAVSGFNPIFLHMPIELSAKKPMI